MAATNTNLRNYTSKVPVDRTVANLEKRLVKAGARHISKFWTKDAVCDGLMVQLPVQGGQLVTFRLPARIEEVYRRFVLGIRGPLSAARARGLREQAARTAWRTLDEMVQMHLDMMDLGQSTLLEAFLSQSYNQATGATLYEAVVASELNLLN